MFSTPQRVAENHPRPRKLTSPTAERSWVTWKLCLGNHDTEPKIVTKQGKQNPLASVAQATKHQVTRNFYFGGKKRNLKLDPLLGLDTKANLELWLGRNIEKNAQESYPESKHKVMLEEFEDSSTLKADMETANCKPRLTFN